VVVVLRNGEMNLKRFTKINAMQIKFTIPESLTEIKLFQYQDFLKLQTDLEKKDVSEVEYMIQVIKIFVKGDLTQIEKLPKAKLEEIFEVLMNMFSTANNQLHKVVKIDGVEYAMHSNLSEITTAEFADIQEYEKKGFNENLHNILAVLYRPIIQRSKGLYRLQPYKGTEGRPKLFKEKFPCDTVNGAMVFFWTLRSDLLITLASYLPQKEINKLSKQAEA
jgi:argonaute-like protein implicated in RNA metabolism and viral defense